MSRFVRGEKFNDQVFVILGSRDAIFSVPFVNISDKIFSIINNNCSLKRNGNFYF